jgi:hypothetical protein
MGGFLQHILQKYFGGKPSKEPYIHEVLKRDEAFLKGFDQWKTEYSFTQLISELKSEYLNMESNVNYAGNLFYTLQKPASNGFILNFQKSRFSVENFQFIFEHFKSVVLGLGYKLYSSESRVHVREKHFEKMERYFLKPMLNKSESGIFDQAYGNITITCHYTDDSPKMIRFLCNNYHDRKYEKASSFDELVLIIFDGLGA